MNPPNRIAVIGNGGGGKSTLSSALANRFDVPWHEVDCIQYGPNWERTPVEETRTAIEKIMLEEKWVLDGFGPYDTIQRRFELADLIVFVDFPLWIHYWWAMERQIAAHLGQKRFGGRDDCDLRFKNKDMCEALWRVDTEIRPKIVKDLKGKESKTKVIVSPEELDAYLSELEVGSSC